MKKMTTGLTLILCLLFFMSIVGSAEEDAKNIRINLKIGDLVIPATLQDNACAKDLLSRLPYTITVYRGSVDFCGSVEPFAAEEEDFQYGWEYGDVIWQPDGDWFVIFTDGYGTYGNKDCVVLAKMDEGWEAIKKLNGSVNIEISLAEEPADIEEE